MRPYTKWPFLMTPPGKSGPNFTNKQIAKMLCYTCSKVGHIAKIYQMVQASKEKMDSSHTKAMKTGSVKVIMKGATTNAMLPKLNNINVNNRENEGDQSFDKKDDENHMVLNIKINIISP